MAPKTLSSKTKSRGADSSSSSPPEALRRLYSWVSSEVLTTGSLMSETDVARLAVPEMAGCVLRAPEPEEPICAGQEIGQPNFFFFYRDYLTRVGVSFPFSDFQMSVLNCLLLAPSQLHPNGWAYVVAFERLCNSFPNPIPCTANLFFHYFCPFTQSSTKESEKLRGLVSLRAEPERKLIGAFSDSFKRFKNAFFKVVAQPRERPWFLHGKEGPDVEWRFPLYWKDTHFTKSPSSYLNGVADLSPESLPHVPRLSAFVKEYGVKSAAWFISGEGSNPASSNCIVLTCLTAYCFRLLLKVPPNFNLLFDFSSRHEGSPDLFVTGEPDRSFS